MSNGQGPRDKVASVAIIGGGRVGCQLLGLFNECSLTRVVYLADPNPGAVGIQLAQAAGIATFPDFRSAMCTAPADFVFEVTGSRKVAQAVKEAYAACGSQVVTHDMARILIGAIDENRQKTLQSVLADTMEIRNDIAHSLKAMAATAGAIRRTTNEMHILALNARMEAARAGEHGRGFDVVAQQVERSAHSVAEMTEDIERVNQNIQGVSERIDATLRRLS